MTPEELNQIRWYVMRAHKSEKKAEERLAAEGGLEYYIPKSYVVRQFHGVKSKRLVPVIPDMIFVHASQKQITDFKKANNFLQFVVWNKSTGPEYLTVPENQMRDFIRVSSNPDADAMYLRPDEVNIAQGCASLGATWMACAACSLRSRGSATAGWWCCWTGCWPCRPTCSPT